MIFAVRSLVVALVGIALFATGAAAQDDVIARARAAASAGNRGEAISMLQDHLKSTPNDVDARLIYGLVLSWDGKYDDARRELTQVLAQAPNYLDARVALMNVEWWSGNTDRARELVRTVLAVDPGNAQARLVKQRIDAKTHPWFVGGDAVTDSFSDRESWREFDVKVGRDTPIGSLTVRANQAYRFGLSDQQVDVEFYPTFRAGTYAFVGIGFGADDELYPDHHLAFDLYQSFGHGWEISGGYRKLAFSETTHIYLGTLTKYVGNWMLTGKVMVVPNELTGNSWSYHGVARWYFGDLGTSYLGAGYTHGFSREEPRSEGDLLRVDADTVRGNGEIDITERLRFSFSTSTSRQERAALPAFWQTTLSSGVTLRF